MRARFVRLCLTTAIAGVLTGCVTGMSEPAPVVSVDNTDQLRLIDEQKSRINELEGQLQASEMELEKASAANTADASDRNDIGLFPPNAQPGKCYARVLIPATYSETTETVLVKEASERVEVIPAQYETVTERVLVRDASTRLETIPPRYETVEERILVRPESKRFEEVPATYKTVTEQVMVSPARTEWKRGPASSFVDNVLQSRTTDTGEVMCLVEIPAQYKTVSRTVVDTPAHTREVIVPAEYRTIKKTVVAEPARTREVEVPAEYDTIEVTKLVAAPSERRIAIPAEYDEVTKRTMVSNEKLQWREVLCQVNLTDTNVRMLQTALAEKGYQSGPIDGVLGEQTLRGANQFAQDKGLPHGSNYIAIEVAEELGLNL